MNIRKITEQANQVSELNDINVTEAVSLKDMGFKKWDYIVPSFRIGRLEGVSADQLTKLFGPPKKGSGDGKTHSFIRHTIVNVKFVCLTRRLHYLARYLDVSHHFSFSGVEDFNAR